MPPPDRRQQRRPLQLTTLLSLVFLVLIAIHAFSSTTTFLSHFYSRHNSVVDPNTRSLSLVPIVPQQDSPPRAFESWPVELHSNVANASLCNPESLSCSCLEQWFGPEACADAHSFLRLGPRRAPRDLNKTIVRLSLTDMASELLLDDGGGPNLYDCQHSLCRVTDASTTRVNHTDVFLGTCDDDDSVLKERRLPWQETYVLDLGQSARCQSGAMHNEQYLPASWADAPAALFEMPPLPLAYKRIDIIVPDISIGQFDQSDLDGLARHLPVVSLTGDAIMDKQVPSSSDLDCSAFVSAWIEGKANRADRAKRLCRLYHTGYILISPDPSPSMAKLILEALQMGCVPVLLGKGPGALAQAEHLPGLNSVIRRSDFQSIDDLGAYLVDATKGTRPTYSTHLLWKSSRDTWPSAFVQQLSQQKGNAICRACDAFARHHESRMSQIAFPVNVREGLGVKGVYQCAEDIFNMGYMIETRPRPDDYYYEPDNRVIDMIYVVNYTPYRDRLRRMLELISNMGLGPARIITAYDREQLGKEEEECFVTSRQGADPLGPGEQSLNIKHMLAYWDMIHHGYNNTLVLEDDVIMSSLFNDKAAFAEYVTSTLKRVPPGQHITYVSGCRRETECNKAIQVAENVLGCSMAVCGSGYVISQDGARKQLSVLPFHAQIDWHHIWAFSESDSPNLLKYYQIWKPPLRQIGFDKKS